MCEPGGTLLEVPKKKRACETDGRLHGEGLNGAYRTATYWSVRLPANHQGLGPYGLFLHPAGCMVREDFVASR